MYWKNRRLVKNFLLVCFLAGLFFVGFAVNAFAKGNTSNIVTIESKPYELSDYSGVTFLYDKNEITLTEDGKFTVVRDIYVYFPTERHGIYLNIPYRYVTSWGNTQNISIAFEDVCFSEFGESREDCTNYQVERSFNEVQLKIGDPDELIEGVYKYHLEYTVTHAIRTIEGYDELYWNVIGTGGENPTIDSQTIVKTSSGLAPEKFVCYTGGLGVEDSDCDIVVNKSNEIVITLSTNLDSYEGYSIVVAYPKDSLGKPSLFETFWNLILPNLGFCLPIPIFVIMFIVWLLWGKDSKPTNVIPQYRPTEGMTPLMAAFLSKMYVSNKDISATVIDLAIRGYIKVEQVGKREYKFHNLRDSNSWEALPEYEKAVLQGLFGTDGSKKEVADKDLTDKFYIYSQKSRANVSRSATSNKYFYGNPAVRAVLFIGIGLTALTMVAGLFYLITGGSSFIVGGVLAALVIIVFGIFMGKRTKLGTQKYGEVQGLRLYIDMAEKERIKFHDKLDPSEKIKVFETLLPYAMVFGLENKWAGEFEDIYKEPPDWYAGYGTTRFNSYYLVSSLSNMNTRMVSVAYGAPGSQGSHASSGRSGFSGGFSGGGFGGGSSGSW